MADKQTKPERTGGAIEQAERKDRDLTAVAAEQAAFGKPIPDGLTEAQRNAAGVFTAPGSKAPEVPVKHTKTIPDRVSERFLRDGDQFHFTGGDQKVAFVDHGAKLVAKSNDVVVARSLVDIAEARGWDAIKVSGATDFKREVWQEAMARGIEVQGYKPTRLEQAEMEQRRGLLNTVEQTTRTRMPVHDVRPAATQYDDTRSASADKSRGALAREQSAAKEGPGQQGQAQHSQPARAANSPAAIAAVAQPPKPRGAPYIVTGTLVQHGLEPYEFKAGGNMSYYATVRTEKGERTLWGDDIGRALAESVPRLKTGDAVRAGHLGRHEVPIPGYPSANRNVWVIERPESYDRRVVETTAEFIDKKPPAARPAPQDAPDIYAHRAELAASFRRDAGIDSDHTVRMVAAHPELLAPAVSMRALLAIAEKNQRVVDMAQFSSLVREAYAQKIEKGEPIKAPQMRPEPPQRVNEREQAQELSHA